MKKTALVLAMAIMALVLGCGRQNLIAAEVTENSEGTATESVQEVLTGWQAIDGSTYYYGTDGTAVTGWQTIDSSKYYFGTDGKMVTGWQTIDSKKYYFGTDGKMVTGWLTIDGNKYYFKKKATDSVAKGEMLTGLWKIGDYKYFFGTKTGKMVTGWKSIDGSKYYFSTKTGRMITGWKTIDGYKYYFSKSGKMTTGWKTIDGYKYYFKKKATSTCPKGAMFTGWHTIGGSKYYFGSSGKMATGWKTINGKKYYFKKKTTSTVNKGAMLTGWWKLGDYRYYFNSKGVLQTNKIVGSKKKGYYYVDSSGVRVTSSEIKYAVKFVTEHSSSGDSASERLKDCYNYLWKNYPYNRTYETPDASTMSDEAVAIFKNGYGNCYKYAAAFACIAKVLGYDARVCVGQISARRGGMTPHGWTEVKVNGTWYLCDPDMQMNYPDRNAYMVTESEYPYTHTVTTKYTLKISKGKVTWK